ncbi:MAG: hypothetical protein LBJ36_12420 [Synergistaceae bacterium]|jgi:hypothetical protein|nr:hypothetical protein [Synergistaceae bacterium]
MDEEARVRYSTKVFAAENRVSASGTARILDNTDQGKLLARRAALTDARRNLIELRRKLLGDPVFKSGARFSGRVVVPDVYSERIEGDLYFLEIDMPLDSLLEVGWEESFPAFR